MTTEQVITEKVSIEDSLKAGLAEIREKESSAKPEADENNEPDNKTLDLSSNEKPLRERDETGKFKPRSKETLSLPEKEIISPETVKAAPVEAPQSWTGPVKEKFSALPPDVQAEIHKREKDFHQMVTRHDGELRLGREMKEAITPYMHIINAEGGTPVAAVQSLLNTAYLLRTGSPEQKASLIQQVAQQYGVDLGAAQTQHPQVDPHIRNLEMRLAQFEQQTHQQKMLQEQEEHSKVVNEISAFAANPANVHFETVKPFMAALLGNGQAKDLQEAYDMACRAHPAIYSTLAASQEADKQAKRKAELEAKKQASVSVTGSPGIAAASTGKHPKRSIEDDLRANLNSLRSSKI